MYDLLYSSNFFYNFLVCTLFLSIILSFSFLVSSKLKKNNIRLFEDYSTLVVFFLIFAIFTFIFNLIILSNKVFLTKPLVYISIAIILGSIFIFIKDFNIRRLINVKSDYQTKIIYFQLLIFYLISILPISDADSIAVHLYFPSYIFLNGLSNLDLSFFFEFTSFSNSEILLFFSPILKSDNFGSQLNLFTLIILSIFLIKDKKYFLLILISCPLIIFFISTQKLQLFFGILYLILFLFVHKKVIKTKLEIFIFLFLLSFYASGKISYILISIPLFIYFLINQKNNLKYIFVSSLLSFLITLLPIFLIKLLYFNNPVAPFFDNIFTQNRLIMEAYSLSLQSSEGWLNNFSSYKIYLKPFVPTSLNTLTNSFGIMFIIFLLNPSLMRDVRFFPIFIIILILATGQILPRYYFEAFL